MIASPELNLTIEPARQAIKTMDAPGSFAWKAFRSIARFVGSVFFPFFRVWGETELKKGGQVFIARNFGLLTWLCALRVFKRPLRFVMADLNDISRWFSLAMRGGLAPLKLSGDADHDFLAIEHLLEAGEKLILLLPVSASSTTELLVAKLKATHSLKVMFMAISGAGEALPEGAIVPAAVPVSVFCGLPHYCAAPGESTLAELDLLERALHNLAIDELPSIFANHQRNIRSQSV